MPLRTRLSEKCPEVPHSNGEKVDPLNTRRQIAVGRSVVELKKC